jgi:uncharacterized protein (DUF2147 family)
MRHTATIAAIFQRKAKSCLPPGVQDVVGRSAARLRAAASSAHVIEGVLFSGLDRFLFGAGANASRKSPHCDATEGRSTHNAAVPMMRPIQISLAAACFAFFAASGAHAQEPVVTGLWQQVDSESGRSQAWFLFRERNGVFEGAIAKMFPEPGRDPNPRCVQCEGDQKNAPFLGLAIIRGMKRHGLDYEDGSILDPRSGTRYNALMRLSPDGRTLTVRGYLGISLFGKDQTWTRLPDSAYAQLDPSVNPRNTSAPAQSSPTKRSGNRTPPSASAAAPAPR